MDLSYKQIKSQWRKTSEVSVGQQIMAKGVPNPPIIV